MQLLAKLTEQLNSMTKSLEILYVIEGLKPLARIMVNEAHANHIKTILQNLNLKISISDFKLKKIKDDARQYSDKGYRLKKTSEESGDVLFYISRNTEYSEKGKSYEAENEHYNLGKILGYPECCVRFFIENFQIESKKKNDYVLASLRNSFGYSFQFYNNIAIRHLDITLLSHFPCKFNCEQSINIAKINLKFIRTLSRDLYNIFYEMLRNCVIYTDTGVFLLKGTNVKSGQIYFNEVISVNHNYIFNFLTAEKNIHINHKNNFTVGEDDISGDNIGVMLFQ